MNLFGITANVIDLFFLIFGKTGKILNAKRNRLCFVIETICLSYWFYIDMKRGLYSQSIFCLISILICIYGYYNWGKIDKK